MCEIGMLVVIEAGQSRTFVTAGFRMALPDVLIWGAEAIPRIEAQTTETDTWPANHQLEFAAILDQDGRRLTIAGSSDTFDTPYQLSLFRRMLSEVWPGYDIQPIVLSTDALADALGIEAPDTDESLVEQIFNEADADETDEEGDDEQDGDEDFVAQGQWGEADTDFRQLTASPPDEPNDLDTDIQWWVTVRGGPGEPYRHFLGNFVLQTLVNSGPDVLAQFAELTETPLPAEDETQRGMLIDAATETISVWSHPNGVRRLKLAEAWSRWSVQHWIDDGFRRQLRQTGADVQYMEASDLEVLSGFVPSLAEELDFSEMVGELKSGFRKFVRSGFGCLAVVLAIPALLAWAASGSWRGPFAFAGGLWLLAYLAYRILAAKMKKSFAPITSGKLNQDAWLSSVAPNSKEERIRIINQSLRGAGFPEYDQIDAFAVRDDDSEQIDPIVSSGG